jgi:hypothetical protein
MLRRFLAWPKAVPNINAEIRDQTPHFETEEFAEFDPSEFENLLIAVRTSSPIPPTATSRRR